MVRVHCRTNIDCAKRLQWPEELPARPMVGDYIRSTSSTRTKHIEMVVCGIVWFQCTDAFSPYCKEWVCQVELDMIRTRFATYDDFENFILRS
jgi:hypothetical protein